MSQSYLFRPLPGQPGHRINGGSGYIVAQELLGTHTHAEKMAGAV